MKTPLCEAGDDTNRLKGVSPQSGVVLEPCNSFGQRVHADQYSFRFHGRRFVWGRRAPFSRWDSRTATRRRHEGERRKELFTI